MSSWPTPKSSPATSGKAPTAAPMAGKKRSLSAVAVEGNHASKRMKLAAQDAPDEEQPAPTADSAPKKENVPSSHPLAAPQPQEPIPVAVTRGDETFDFVDLDPGRRHQVVDTVGRTVNCTVTQGLVRVTMAGPMFRSFTLGEKAFFQLKEGETCIVANAEKSGQTAVVFLLGKPVAGRIEYGSFKNVALPVSESVLEFR